MNHNLTKILMDLVSDEIDFNNQVKLLIEERNSIISNVLDLAGKELKDDRGDDSGKHE